MMNRFVALLLALVAGFWFAVYRTRAARDGSAESPEATSDALNAKGFSDYRTQQPGATHKISVEDLPAPFSTKSVDNGPDEVSRPRDAWPKAPAGFKVDLYASGLDNPRLIRTAPNGDIFLAESHPGRIRVLRGISDKGEAQKSDIFATGLRQPFGIAFYPPGPDPKWVYVGNTDSVVRFPYRRGDMKASAASQKIADLPAGGLLRGGGHWTRDIAFSNDGKKMYVSIGSYSNADDTDNNRTEHNRADVLEFNPDGTSARVYAFGIRNAVGIAVHPATDELWGSVNERDGLGDNLVPDYITHIQNGGFYGWPWYYMGKNQDPRLKDKHPDLRARVITPDVLVQPHNASLEMTFYDGRQFPDAYKGDIFAAEHGSWNKRIRTGYEVVRVPLHGRGRATGEYEDFLTGFVTADGNVWGRPVGVAVGPDGSLMVSDDGSNSIWRVSYRGN
jgi:glucose/arabinose dehydrogenase